MKALTLLGNAWTMVSIVRYVIDADFIDKLNCFEVEKTEIIPDNFRILISDYHQATMRPLASFALPSQSKSWIISTPKEGRRGPTLTKVTLNGVRGSHRCMSLEQGGEFNKTSTLLLFLGGLKCAENHRIH